METAVLPRPVGLTTDVVDSLYSLLPILGPIMRPRASPRAALSIRFSVHWTRTFAHAPQVPRTTLPPGMYIRAGRPDIHATLQSMIDSLRDAYSMSECCKCSGASPSGIVIGTCGPLALIDDSVRAVNKVSWADWIDMGGVESVEECVKLLLLLAIGLTKFLLQAIRMVKHLSFFS